MKIFISSYGFSLLSSILLFQPERPSLAFCTFTGNKLPQSLFLCRCVYFSLIFGRTDLLKIEFSVPLFPPTHPFKQVIPLFSPFVSKVSDEESTDNLIGDPLCIMSHFCLVAFNSLSLIFDSLIMMCLLWVSEFHLEFVDDIFWFVDWSLSSDLWLFVHYFFKLSFCPVLTSWDFHNAYVGVFVSLKSFKLCSFHCFVLFFILILSILLSPGSLILPSRCSVLLLNLFSEFFILIIVPLKSWIFNSFFNNFSFLIFCSSLFSWFPF